MTQAIDGEIEEPTIEEVAYFLMPPEGSGLTIKSYGEMLENLDILKDLEKDMESVTVVGECPKHHWPFIMKRRDNGDNLFFCGKCNKSYFRFGHAGPLCEHGIGR